MEKIKQERLNLTEVLKGAEQVETWEHKRGGLGGRSIVGSKGSVKYTITELNGPNGIGAIFDSLMSYSIEVCVVPEGESSIFVGTFGCSYNNFRRKTTDEIKIEKVYDAALKKFCDDGIATMNEEYQSGVELFRSEVQ